MKEYRNAGTIRGKELSTPEYDSDTLPTEQNTIEAKYHSIHPIVNSERVATIQVVKNLNNRLEEIKVQKAKNTERKAFEQGNDSDREKQESKRIQRFEQMNVIARFLAQRLPQKKDINEIKPLYRDPVSLAHHFINDRSFRSELDRLRSAIGTFTGLFALRSTSRGVVANIFNRSKWITYDRLSQFGLDLMKLGTDLDEKMEDTRTTWETFAQRLSSSTAFYSIALHRRREITTKDIADDEEGKKKCWGLGATPVIVHCHITGKEADKTNLTLSIHHQVNGEPAIKLADKISEVKPSKVSAIDKIADTAYRTIEILTADYEIKSTEEGRVVRLKGVDYYKTNHEYAMYTGEIESEHISLCVNGYELILNIRNEDGSMKSRGQIRNAIEFAMAAGRIAQKLKQTVEDPNSSKRLKRIRYKQAKHRGLTSQLFDVRAATISEETFEAARPIAQELKRTSTNGVSQFDLLSKSLFRLSINIDIETESETENYRDTLQVAQSKKAQLPEFGLTELFDGTRIQRSDLQELREAEEQSDGEAIVTEDITDQLQSLKELISGRLREMLKGDRAKVMEEQEVLIRKMTGDAKVLEVVLFAIGKHPVNCVIDQIEHDLAISNTYTENSPELASLRKTYSYIQSRAEQKYTIDEEVNLQLRTSFLQSLSEVYIAMEKASISESVNHHLIQASRSCGAVMANSPVIVRRIVQSTFLLLGGILPQFYGGKEFLNDLRKLDPTASPEKVAADTAMILTRMMNTIENLEADISGLTVSVPKTERKYAGVGTTAAFKRGGDIVMVNPIDDQKYLTIRGPEAEETRKMVLQAFNNVLRAF